MIVSNFELLFKPLNLGPRFATRHEVVQGYFLAISNLENRIINLRLRLIIPDSKLPAFDREIETEAVPFVSANTRVVFDNADLDDFRVGLASITPKRPDTKEFITNSFSLSPNQTVSVAILPNKTNLEVRGFTVLEQVPVGLGQTLLGVKAAVVLTTPDHRNTTVELDDNNPGRVVRVADFDQTAYTLLTASGRAQNTVEAIRGLIQRPPVFDPSDGTVTLDDAEIIRLEKTLVEALQNSKSVVMD